jgi:hypothetical protein
MAELANTVDTVHSSIVYPERTIPAESAGFQHKEKALLCQGITACEPRGQIQ